MKKTPARKLLVTALVALLAVFALGILPRAVHAEASADLSAAVRTEAEIDELVDRLLSAGDYAEGEAIVCYLPTGGDGLTAQANDLLIGGEHLSEVTSRQYAEATGEALPAADDGVLTAQAAEQPVEITFVRSDLSTGDLLRELLRDPRVLSAEPNYIAYPAEEDSDEPTTEEPPAVVVTEDATEEVSADQTEVETEPENEAEVEADASEQSEAEAKAEEPETEAEASNPTPESVLALAAQSDPANGSKDLTGYQWFNNGTANTISQYPGWTNPGVKAPNWNTPGATNAGGVVAIMDSGVDYTHPDLAGVMYHFSPELQAQLGCGEFGYAPEREDKTDITDRDDHGTHVAGIMVAEWNDFGVSGIASGAKLIGVAIPGDEGFPSNYTLVKGYDFLVRAAKAGVDIRAVNRSIELPLITNAVDVMVQAAGEVGIVTTVASGNAALDLEDTYSGGSMLQSSPYLLRVNASDMLDRRAHFTNYGAFVTDVFAPGTAILSTVPNRVDEKRYYPSADSDPLFLRTNFNNSLMDVTPGTDLEQTLTVESISQAPFGVDGDDSSLKVEVKATSGSMVELFLDVPAVALSANEVQDIALAFTVGANGVDDAELGAVLDNGGNVLSPAYKGKAWSTSYATPDGWCFAYLHILDPEGMGAFKQYVDASGNTCVRLTLAFKITSSSGEAGSEVHTDLYLDQVGFGKPGNDAFLPYQYFSGTSMAAPATAGAAAIVSATIDGADPAARAAATVSKLKSAVHQAEGYAGYCKQNGQIDLSLLGQTDGLAPSIDSASVSDASLVLKGGNFSSGGAVTLGGKQAEVTSWSDGTIEVTWPEGLTSGLIPVTVKTDAGTEVCRAFILEAPEQFAGSVSVYEHGMAPVRHAADGVDVTLCPESMTVTEDGVLYVAAQQYVSNMQGIIPSLMRSDDHGSSWTSVALPRPLLGAHLGAGDGKVFVMGVQGDVPYNDSMLELYSMDEATGAFTLLGTYDETEINFRANGLLAYVDGHLYIVDMRLGAEDMSKPSHLCVQRFSDDYKTATEPYLLNCEFPCYGVHDVKCAVVGNSIYVLGADEYDPNGWYADFLSLTAAALDPEALGRTLVGLERVDVGADGTLTSTNLSSTLVGIPKLGLDGEEIGFAACKDGIFLVSSVLAEKLPAGSERTDTFVLKPGADKFEPYTKTLSYAPMTMPIAACSPDGWLYAFAVSDYEDTTIFGRATKVVSAEPGPEPQPQPEPQPDSKPSEDTTPSKRASSRTLPKTGDPAAAIIQVEALLALAGLTCAALGMVARRKDS